MKEDVHRYSFRPATPDDAQALAYQRSRMFRDMGIASESEADAMSLAGIAWFQRILASGEYTGWLVLQGETIVGGSGVHLRELGPMPGCLQGGRSGHVANIYIDPAHRRRGLARGLLESILRWALAQKLNRLSLTASEDGRPLYEAFGFKATADMQVLACDLPRR